MEANYGKSLEVVSQYVAAMASRETEKMDNLRSEGFVLDYVHDDAFHDQPLSAHDTRVFWPAWLAAFEEYDYEVTRTVAAKEVIVTEWVFTGTHTKPLGPPVFDSVVQATGRTIRFRGVSIYAINDGLIERETLYMDLATLLVELGAIP